MQSRKPNKVPKVAGWWWTESLCSVSCSLKSPRSRGQKMECLWSFLRSGVLGWQKSGHWPWRVLMVSWWRLANPKTIADLVFSFMVSSLYFFLRCHSKLMGFWNTSPLVVISISLSSLDNNWALRWTYNGLAWSFYTAACINLNQQSFFILSSKGILSTT